PPGARGSLRPRDHPPPRAATADEDARHGERRGGWKELTGWPEMGPLLAEPGGGPGLGGMAGGRWSGAGGWGGRVGVRWDRFLPSQAACRAWRIWRPEYRSAKTSALREATGSGAYETTLLVQAVRTVLYAPCVVHLLSITPSRTVAN